MKCGNLYFLEPSGPLQACNGTALTSTSSISLHEKLRAAQTDKKVSSFYEILIFVTKHVKDVNAT
jgi:hypothetical protein